ncbi:hypothetical protein, partial [Trueperella pyogenes]
RSSARRSATIRTARSLNSCEYLFDMFQSSQKQEGTKPSTLHPTTLGRQPPHPQRLDRTLTTRRHKQRFLGISPFDHHIATDFASRISHPSIKADSKPDFPHPHNEKLAPQQHELANQKVESKRLFSHKTASYQRKIPAPATRFGLYA